MGNCTLCLATPLSLHLLVLFICCMPILKMVYLKFCFMSIYSIRIRLTVVRCTNFFSSSNWAFKHHKSSRSISINTCQLLFCCHYLLFRCAVLLNASSFGWNFDYSYGTQTHTTFQPNKL